MLVVLYLQVMMIKEMMVHLLMNLNVDHSYHLNIVIVEVVNDVASLNVDVNDVDSSSNCLMTVVVVVASLMKLVLKDHKHFHDDDQVHDDVDNEMY
jgi:hypothetical protein